jgi:hypothetical protein
MTQVVENEPVVAAEGGITDYYSLALQNNVPHPFPFPPYLTNKKDE